jgi:hypothetical protein
MSAAGYSLQQTLSGANAYGSLFSSYKPGTPMATPSYPSIHNPLDYLTWFLPRLAAATSGQVEGLLPHDYAATIGRASEASGCGPTRITPLRGGALRARSRRSS